MARSGRRHRILTALGAVALVLGLTAEAAYADRTIYFYRDPPLAANTYYGFGPFSADRNLMYCGGAAPYSSRIFTRVPGSSVNQNIVTGTCNIQWWAASVATRNWYCHNQTGYAQVGYCAVSWP
jgi:hypothetical protein